MPLPEFLDDQTILDQEILWHRVFPLQIETDPSTQRMRPQAGAFRTPDHYLSVDISSLTTQEIFLSAAPEMKIAEFSAGAVRRVGCRVRRDPVPGNPAHALVAGDHKNGGLTKRQAKLLANESFLIGS